MPMMKKKRQKMDMTLRSCGTAASKATTSVLSCGMRFTVRSGRSARNRRTTVKLPAWGM